MQPENCLAPVPTDVPAQVGAPALDPTSLLAEKLHFWQHGYVIVRQAFTPAEMEVVHQKIRSIEAMNQRVEHVRKIQSQGEHPSFETILVWNDVARDDLFAKVGRSYKLLDRLSYYFDDDVYGYHNKISLKYPGIVGFRPHQDYAYWKDYGCRLPEAHAVFISIDRAPHENGCLRLMPRSHLLGTLPHRTWSGQRGSDNGVEPDVLQGLFDRGYELMPIETEPGDIILFHGHTIHGSNDNLSDKPRLAMIATMNTRRNSPDPRFNRPGHPYWTHQIRVHASITEADLALDLPDFALHFKNDATHAANHSARVSA